MYMYIGLKKNLQYLYLSSSIPRLYIIVEDCFIPPQVELGMLTRPNFVLYEYLSSMIYWLFYDHGNAT